MFKILSLICFCIFTCVICFAKENLLHKKISISIIEKPLQQVLKEIETQSGLSISIDDKLLQGWGIVNYEIKDQEIGRILTRILKSRGLGFVDKNESTLEVIRLNPQDEFKIKSEQNFEFAEKPIIKREADTITISFETKGFCDATLAIEDLEGNILRHLASGVLGENAPLPFQWNSKKQTIIWDGKNDQGNYVKNKESVVIRVSLGLKPQFEKNLFWDPRKRSSNGWGGSNAPTMKASPEGVYVYDPGVMERLSLFDHDGNYLRTIYPFPNDKTEAVLGLQKHTFPQDGKTLPFKSGFEQSTLLFGSNAPKMPKRGEASFNATSLAVQGNRIALVGSYVSRLGTDGTSSGLQLGGPKTTIYAVMRGGNQSVGNDGSVRPTSSAFSPDGKTLYMTGYMWRYSWHNDSMHGVTRITFDQDKEPELFVGSMKQDDSGTEEGKFRGATSVACDSKGRVYVTDHINDRVQVFSPEGKFLKAIPVFRPAVISINPKNGEIYVFSWMTPNRFHLNLAKEHDKAHKPLLKIEPKLFKLGTFDNPKDGAGGYPLPLPVFSGSYQEWWNLSPIQTVGEVDFHSEPPTIWISQSTDNNFKGNWDKIGNLLLREKDGKLVVHKDFGKEVVSSIARVRPPMLDRQRLYVNPKSGKLYVGEADSGVGKSFGELVEIDPETGKVKIIKLPYNTEDMAYDLEGCAYLRTDPFVVRFDSNTWREIPWDYGSEQTNVSFEGGSPQILSALSTPGHRSPSFWHMGGMFVSATGNVAVACPNPGESLEMVPGEEGKDIKSTSTKYNAQIYNGRMRWGEIHVWDKHGKLIREDVFPGIGHMNGIGIDSSDNIYVMANGTRLFDGKPYDPKALDDLSETLLKTSPKGTKVLSSNSNIGVPIGTQAPKRSLDFVGFPNGGSWVDGADWMYGGIGYTGNASWDGGGCRCWNARFTLDYFARSFAPETRHFSVAVLDTNGNLITRIGKYGNVDDGKPLVATGGAPSPKSIGGDEVGLFHAAYVGTLTDKRLFIADAGNARILSVKLNYNSEEKINLKDIKDQSSK
jgi:hypothetical protein